MRMGLAKTANNLSLMYKRKGALDLAKSHMDLAIEHYERLGKIASIAGMKINVAAYYNYIKEYDQAIEVGLEAIEIFAKLLNERGQAMAAQNLSESYLARAVQNVSKPALALGDLEQAEKYSRIVIESEEVPLLPDGYRVFGEIAAQRGDFPTAEKFINDAIELAQSNQDPWLEAYAHRALGKVYQMQGQSDRADAAFSKAIVLFEELGLENEVEATRAD